MKVSMDCVVHMTVFIILTPHKITKYHNRLNILHSTITLTTCSNYSQTLIRCCLFTTIYGGIARVAVYQKAQYEGISIHRLQWAGAKWSWCFTGRHSIKVWPYFNEIFIPLRRFYWIPPKQKFQDIHTICWLLLEAHHVL